MTPVPDPRSRLISGAFADLWICVVLVYSQYNLLQPLVPLMVVDRGGDAALVGLTALAFGLPSILVRPLLGQLVDRRGDRILVVIGAATLGLTGLIYAMPAVIAIFVARVIHGIGWAALNTGGYSLLARLAPPNRRGEASGYYAVAPALAQLLMPGLAILLYTSFGANVPLFVASFAALLGMSVIWKANIAPREPEPPEQGSRRRSSGLAERSAIMPMALESVNAATQSIFTFFMPVIILGLGLSVESLVTYYPAYGIVMVAGRLLSSRISDRVGRIPTLIIGATMAFGALLVAAVAPDLIVLTVAGCLAALSGALVRPTLSALTIDRAPSNRIGAAVATYSLGYQIGLGLGGAVWGVVISTTGIRSPFMLAALLQIAVIAFLWRGRHSTRGLAGGSEQV